MIFSTFIFRNTNSGRSNATAISLVLSLVLAVSACAARAPGETTTAARANDFALRDNQGRDVRLSDYIGNKVVLITFWATWCAPCSTELPALQQLYSKYEPDGFIILGISMDGPETIASVGPMTRQLGVEFPILLDEETRVVGMYNPKRAAPYSLLIGLDGKVAKRRDGYTPGDEIDIERDVKTLLAKRTL